MPAAMRYKDFIWPHNPRSYKVRCEQPCVSHKIPLGGWYVQELGPAARVMDGEGAFYGPDAYTTFRTLEALFREGGPGMLVHPVWPAGMAYFTRLELEQEPLPDYVTYRFTFREGGRESRDETAGETAPGYLVAREGDTLWSMAADYGTTAQALLALNPELPSPNDLQVGDRVRIW